ncbi:hypothetical protein M7I_3707 [Glarea lozoyensis 74030]|uniref:Uncharacterized protein n=1 Tax=Glarea lozoyensis (strain ATCC 74030 / MF5533) TaxID=1104152 RepID=H0EM77_GLAL7|nr:hypothetical protein M7I_3707 [Glarea lozoyensis 74030]
MYRVLDCTPENLDKEDTSSHNFKELKFRSLEVIYEHKLIDDIHHAIAVGTTRPVKFTGWEIGSCDVVGSLKEVGEFIKDIWDF